MKKSILLLLLALVAYGISSINSKDSADEKIFRIMSAHLPKAPRVLKSTAL